MTTSFERACEVCIARLRRIVAMKYSLVMRHPEPFLSDRILSQICFAWILFIICVCEQMPPVVILGHPNLVRKRNLAVSDPANPEPSFHGYFVLIAGFGSQ